MKALVFHAEPIEHYGEAQKIVRVGVADGELRTLSLLPRTLGSRLFTLPNAASSMPWAVLAAIPETYYTAWGSLFECLRLEAGDRLLVRGASCGLGYAAIQMAKATGCRVLATTHRERYRTRLLDLGVDEVIVDESGVLAGGGVEAEKVLELVGPRTVRDSLKLLAPRGICCQAGILGGAEAIDGFDPIKEIPNGRYLTGFFSNSPTQVAMNAVFAMVAENAIEPPVAAVFRFEDLKSAIEMQDAGGFQGKIVVVSEE